MGNMGVSMFALKQETVSIDGIEFTVSEPMARDVIDMNKAEQEGAAIFLISRCVSVDGKVLGDEASKMPARYLNTLSEAVSRLGGWAEAEAGNV